MSRKCAITTFLSRKFMITRPSIAFEDFLGSSIAPQVMPPCYCRGFLLLFSPSSSSMPSEWCRLLTSIVSGQYPPISPICPRPTPAPPHCTFCYSDILRKIFVHLCRLLIVLVQGSPFHLSSIDDQRNLQNVGNAKNCNFKIPEILLALPRGTVVWRQNC